MRSRAAAHLRVFSRFEALRAAAPRAAGACARAFERVARRSRGGAAQRSDERRGVRPDVGIFLRRRIIIGHSAKQNMSQPS